MTDRELKKMIANAYEVEPSYDKEKFLKQFRSRELHIWDVICQQSRGIGLINLIVSLLVLFIIWQILLRFDGSDILEFARISSLIPVIAIAAISGMGRSEKYGMDELEMSTRFSLRTVMSARLIIVGVIDLALLILLLIIFGRCTDLGMLQALMVLTIPYLLTAWGCLLITRKMHNSMEIGVCFVYGMMVCLMCATTSWDNPWRYFFMGTTVSYLCFAVLCVLLGLEVNKLIKGENSKWNLC